MTEWNFDKKTEVVASVEPASETSAEIAIEKQGFYYKTCDNCDGQGGWDHGVEGAEGCEKCDGTGEMKVFPSKKRPWQMYVGPEIEMTGNFEQQVVETLTETHEETGKAMEDIAERLNVVAKSIEPLGEALAEASLVEYIVWRRELDRTRTEREDELKWLLHGGRL